MNSSDANSSSSAIDVRSVTVRRKRKTILDDISFTVGQGSVTGLLGPSGCGKTTLMRTVVGVQKFSSGTITVLGQPAGHRRLRRDVGYVTQSPSIYDDLTVRQNVRYFGVMYGTKAESVDRAIEDVGLLTYRDTLTAKLSGGQRARVSLACALIARPKLLVLDEPTVGLDPVLRRDLWASFHSLADDGTTLLVSSHVMDEAERCDRLLLMREGSVLADSDPAGLLGRTGADTLEGAFLRLIESSDGARSSTTVKHLSTHQVSEEIRPEVSL
ncbi:MULTISPECIES: ABC transporter ATP-binding protein [unclassified Nocardia]|uniref:ABC transporter ATP-binding protein n=1 Tax=unclassified Nocardia TaxID=2637762 RepID=UPI0034414A07